MVHHCDEYATVKAGCKLGGGAFAGLPEALQGGMHYTGY